MNCNLNSEVNEFDVIGFIRPDIAGEDKDNASDHVREKRSTMFYETTLRSTSTSSQLVMVNMVKS